MKLYDTVRLLLTTSLTDREVGEALGSSKSTANRLRHRVKALNRPWEDDLAKLRPKELAKALGMARRGPRPKRLPDWAAVERALRNPLMTLQLVWVEYRQENPDGLSYSQFAAHYRAYRKAKPITMRQEHVPGERVFVDFSGRRPCYVDPETGEVVKVELFVAVMGAGSLTYATCVPTQTTPDWIAVNVKMMNYFGGSPRIIVPDNLKAAVIKPGKAGREPTFTRAYQDFARHYSMAIVPARPRRPKDKAKVEAAVRLVQRWVLARLRQRTFFSLADLNAAIAGLLEDVNGRPMRHHGGLSRRQRFEQLDQPVLRSLPAEPHVYTEWVGSQLVPPDYHLGVRGHFYSLPHGLVGQRVEARLTETHVCLYHDHQLVATHPRSAQFGGYSTTRAHAPAGHRAMADRTPALVHAWAARVGPSTAAVVGQILNRRVPEQGLPACASLQHLADRYGNAALESAASYGLKMRAATVSNLRTYLRTGIHVNALPPIPVSRASDVHARGPSYYREEAPC